MLSTLINFGSEHKLPRNANRIKTLNIISILTSVIATGYVFFYLFVINNLQIALINCCFVLAYTFPLLFNYLGLNKLAKIWFFVILMVHLYIFTNIILTPAAGIHLYYFLVPTGTFLLFEFEDKFEKYSLSILSVFMFIICHNIGNDTPMAILTDAQNSLLFQGAMFVNIVEVIVVLALFTNELERSHNKLEYQATVDALTKIANRRQLFNLGEQLLSQAREHQRPVAILLLDFDHFKQINDSYGHSAGDTCLQNSCQQIKEQLRQQDIFARLGGEEFAVLLPDTTLSEAQACADKIREKVEQHIISVSKNTQIKCTVSIGIAGSTNDNYDLKELLHNADIALYQSKHKGRNRITSFHNGLAA